MIQFRPYNQKKDRLVKEIFESLGIEKQAFYSEDAKYFLIDTGEEIIGICAYEMIEDMFPNTTRLEMFARNERVNWDSWGNEVSCT